MTKRAAQRGIRTASRPAESDNVAIEDDQNSHEVTSKGGTGGWNVWKDKNPAGVPRRYRNTPIQVIEPHRLQISSKRDRAPPPTRHSKGLCTCWAWLLGKTRHSIPPLTKTLKKLPIPVIGTTKSAIE